jgi:hypothetical protein
MATRGKIKMVKDPGNGNYTGLVTDTVNKIDYTLSQPLGRELGLQVNDIVRMEIINLSDGTQLAVSLNPVEMGKITTLDAANDTGTITDRAGNVLTIVQNYITELGLAVGDKVTYSIVMNAGVMTATTLQKV